MSKIQQKKKKLNPKGKAKKGGGTAKQDCPKKETKPGPEETREKSRERQKEKKTCPGKKLSVEKKRSIHLNKRSVRKRNVARETPEVKTRKRKEGGFTQGGAGSKGGKN